MFCHQRGHEVNSDFWKDMIAAIDHNYNTSAFKGTLSFHDNNVGTSLFIALLVIIFFPSV